MTLLLLPLQWRNYVRCISWSPMIYNNSRDSRPVKFWELKKIWKFRKSRFKGIKRRPFNIPTLLIGSEQRFSSKSSWVVAHWLCWLREKVILAYSWWLAISAVSFALNCSDDMWQCYYKLSWTSSKSLQFFQHISQSMFLSIPWSHPFPNKNG